MKKIALYMLVLCATPAFSMETGASNVSQSTTDLWSDLGLSKKFTPSLVSPSGSCIISSDDKNGVALIKIMLMGKEVCCFTDSEHTVLTYPASGPHAAFTQDSLYAAIVLTEQFSSKKPMLHLFDCEKGQEIDLGDDVPFVSRRSFESGKSCNPLLWLSNFWGVEGDTLAVLSSGDPQEAQKPVLNSIKNFTNQIDFYYRDFDTFGKNLVLMASLALPARLIRALQLYPHTDLQGDAFALVSDYHNQQGVRSALQFFEPSENFPQFDTRLYVFPERFKEGTRIHMSFVRGNGLVAVGASEGTTLFLIDPITASCVITLKFSRALAGFVASPASGALSESCYLFAVMQSRKGGQKGALIHLADELNPKIIMNGRCAEHRDPITSLMWSTQSTIILQKEQGLCAAALSVLARSGKNNTSLMRRNSSKRGSSSRISN
jgi:hypothetical protein